MIDSKLQITLEKNKSAAYKKYYNTYFNEVFSTEKQDWNNLLLGAKYFDIPNYQKKLCLYNHRNKLSILTKSDVLAQGIDQIVATNENDTISEILKKRIYDKKTMFFLKLKYKYDKVCEKTDSDLLNNLSVSINNLHTNFRDIHYYFTSYGYIQNIDIYAKLQSIVRKEISNIDTDISKIANKYDILKKNKTYAKVFEYMLKYNYRLIPIEEYIYFNENNYKDIHKEKDFIDNYNNSKANIINEVDLITNQKINTHYTNTNYKKKRNRNLTTKILNLLVSKRVITSEEKYTIKNYRKSNNQIFVWHSDILNHILVVYRGTFGFKSENVHSDIIVLTNHSNESIRIQNNRHLFLNHIKYYIEHIKKINRELLNDHNLIVTFAGHSLGGNICKDINKTIIENNKSDMYKPYLVITYNHLSTPNIRKKQDNEFDIYTDTDYASLRTASVPQDPNNIIVKHKGIKNTHSILSIGKYLYKDTTPYIFVNDTDIKNFLNKSIYEITENLKNKSVEISDDLVRKTVLKVIKNEPCICNPLSDFVTTKISTLSRSNTNNKSTRSKRT